MAFPMEIFRTPVKDENDEITNYITIGTDITERKKLQENLDILRKEYQSFMRHELNNLITPIKGFAQILLMNPEKMSESQIEKLFYINDSVDRATNLIENLGKLQDFEQGKYNLEKNECDLNEIINQAILDLKIFADKSDVTIQIHYEKQSNIVTLDKNLFLGVITNLVKNAVEHVAGEKESSQKDVVINVKSNKKFITLSINNKGEPVPKEKLKLFFEKFNTDKSKKKEGTGLGTTYAYLVVKAHGGNIHVDSNQENGTTVTIQLHVV